MGVALVVEWDNGTSSDAGVGCRFWLGWKFHYPTRRVYFGCRNLHGRVGQWSLHEFGMGVAADLVEASLSHR